jgi:hypothetical protein
MANWMRYHNLHRIYVKAYTNEVPWNVFSAQHFLLYIRLGLNPPAMIEHKVQYLYMRVYPLPTSNKPSLATLPQLTQNFFGEHQHMALLT